MQRAEQIAIGHQLFDYIDNRTTAMADEVYHQPVREYTCPDIAAQEQRVFFRQRPLCVGMSGLLPEPGTYFTHDLNGLPILLTRADDGEVRALLNVCRHRGSRVAEAGGKSRSFVCPYHAWTYGLDGKLVARPQDASFAAAPRARHGLTQLTAIERDGLIWISPAPGQMFSLDDHLEGLGDEIAAYGLAGFHHYESRLLKRRMNWKLLIDTFLESYHFCVLHKDSICSIFYENLTTFDTWGPHFRLVAARRTIEDIRQLPVSSWNLLPYMVAIYVFFPNTVLIWQLDHAELWQIFPDDGAPEESKVLLSLYTPEPAITDSDRRHWDNNMDLVVHVVENEDFPVGEGIQRGFHSGAQDHTVFGENEPALAHFHRTLTGQLDAARVRS